MIIVMGLPGAGKSTVLQKMMDRRTDYKLINYGDMMLRVEQEKGWVKTRDEMRKLPVEKQKIAQGLVAKALAREKGNVILDTHCSISTPFGYYPGMPFSFLKGLKVDKLVYVTASAEEIKQRRSIDATRVRDNDDVEAHDKFNRHLLASYAAFTGSPASIVINRQGKLGETVEKMLLLL